MTLRRWRGWLSVAKTHSTSSTRKGWRDAVLKVAGQAVQWIYAVWVTGEAEGYGQGQRRCDAGALGGRHVAWKSIHEHLVSRNPEGVVVRTRTVHDPQKSPILKDLDRIVGHLHTPQSVHRYRRLEVPRPETLPEPQECRPVQCPIRVVLFHVRSTSPESCWKGMVIPRDAKRRNAVRRGQTHGTGGHSADCRKRMEAALTQDEEYQFKMEQANFRKDQYCKRSRSKHEETPRNE